MMEIVLILVCLAVWLLVARLPVTIAKHRRHNNVEGVKLMTIIGVVIPLCWIAAVIWACAGTTIPAKGPLPVKLSAKALNYDPAWEVDALDREVSKQIDADSELP